MNWYTTERLAADRRAEIDRGVRTAALLVNRHHTPRRRRGHRFGLHH